MPVFSYKAINDDGNEVSGTIDAPTVDAAKEAISALRLELVSVAESTRIGRQPVSTPKPVPAIAPSVPPVIRPAPPPSPLPAMTFTFEGTDEGGKVHTGTIQAANKKEAFDRIQRNRSLQLSSLTPSGQPPKADDQDLAQWQRNVRVRIANAPPEMYRHSVEKEVINDALPPVIEKKEVAQEKAIAAPQKKGEYFQYLPLTQTFRLYCGWLLAWYVLFIAIGHYSATRQLPISIPIVEGFYLSPLIFSFIIAIFLFLLLTSVQKALKGGFGVTLVLTAVGAMAFLYVRSSIV